MPGNVYLEVLINETFSGTISPQELADPDSEFIQVNELKVHCKIKGTGQPVMVLLHGFAASTYSWREVMAPLAETGTVIAFDRPASGLTERTVYGTWQGNSPYSPESQVALTVGLMDELGYEKAVLVGNSAGGTIAAYTALLHPRAGAGARARGCCHLRPWRRT